MSWKGSLRGMIDRIRQYTADMSMLRKMMLALLVALLVPVLTIGSYIYYQLQEYTRSEIIKNGHMTLLQMKDNINTRLLLATKIGQSIAYEPNIFTFLSSELIFDADSLAHYRDIINPLIEHAMYLEK